MKVFYRLMLLVIMVAGLLVRGWTLHTEQDAVTTAHSIDWFDGQGVKRLQWDSENPFVAKLDGSIVPLIKSGKSVTPQVSVWDPNAIVLVSVGTDGAPGVAEVDDDGNAVVDDVSELGATGSDDRVLTPDDTGYQDAESGKVFAKVLSRGAMKRVAGDIIINAPAQVRIDAIDAQNQMTSKIIDLK